MSDLRTLLNGADGGPVQPLDIGVATRRARVRASRQRAGGVVALMLLVGALLPILRNASQDSGVAGRIGERDRAPAVRPEEDRSRPDSVRATHGAGSQRRGEPATDTKRRAGGETARSRRVESLGLTGRLAFTLTEGRVVGRAGSCLDSPCTTHPSPSDIRIMHLGRGSVAPLTSSPMMENESEWSPDGSRLAYSATGDTTGGTTSLYTIRPDGSDNQRIVSMTGAMARKPTWSPDGRRIAFLLEQSSSNPSTVEGVNENEIWMVDADGSDAHRIDEITSENYPTSPAWSPDGRYLAFVRIGSGSSAVWILDLDTDEIEFLAEGSQPAWAPDGKRMVVTSGDTLRVVAVPSGEELSVISSEGRQLGEAAWSPDGTWITFAAANPDTTRRSIWVARPNGRELNPVVEGDEDYWAPTWTAGP